LAKIKAIRGMNDILPEQTRLWQFFESKIRTVLGTYGYDEIRMPMVESTDLFKRSIGEVTDIVEKEMYTFDDRNGDSLTLRPEGTASCVRACEEHGLLYNQTQRLWYMGPMFRYERPQKGRYRQFHQIGAEAFGMTGPDIDAELILMSARFWRELGIQDIVTLQLNTLGSLAARNDYREALVAYLSQNMEQLDEDSKRRLTTNPLRILDSKNPQTQALLDGAPNLHDFLDQDSREHFESLRSLLDRAGLKYEINQRLVRGLDYYGKTVFEWVTDHLGAQGTICAGGRYDGLVEQLGGRPVPAVGFAMGVERLILLIEAAGSVPDSVQQKVDLFVAVAGLGTESEGLLLAERLRSDMQLRIQLNCGGGSLKSQLKRADKSGAPYALLLGEDELLAGKVVIKPLRGQGEQHLVDMAELSAVLKDINLG